MVDEKEDLNLEPQKSSLSNSCINENTLINVNDIVETLCDNDNTFHQARILQIKDDNTKTVNNRLFYVHIMDYEKRMDRWIDEKSIRKIVGYCDHLGFTTEKENIESVIKIKNVEKIILGYYEIDAWYYSPYPQEFTVNKVLFICENCLKYMRKKSTLLKHLLKCTFNNPPGIEIYNQPIYSTKKLKDIDKDIEIELGNQTNQSECDTKREITSMSVYEIKGGDQKLYCQNLCLLAKLFLDHKSIYFDVTPFKFYVLTENDKNGKHLVAYFSKESSSISEFNLACIMVLPPYQRKGYGQFLISMSYYFSNVEGRTCTPETPLSDLGRISYKAYWTNTILECLLKHKGNLSLKELGEHTGIKHEDVISTLNDLTLIKYWKGKQVIQTINMKQLEDFLSKKKAKKLDHIKFDKSYIL